MKKKFSLRVVVFFMSAVLIIGVAMCALLAKNTDIPKLYFEGNISEMLEKSDVRSISFTYKDGDRTVEGYAKLKIQGTSSIWYDKKNYTIQFYEDPEHENKLKIDVGWGEQNKYCLKANWIDRTHARNVVTARIVSQVQQKYDLLNQAPRNGAVDGFPVEIYSNGAFLGLYTFNIPKDEWQFGMNGDDPNHIVICGEGWEPANLFEAMPDFNTWGVEVGQESDETLEKMNVLFDFVINSTDEEFRSGFDTHLDMDAVLNYYVLCDFAYLPDNLGKNMLIATYDGVKWYPSLYDLDTSWGSDYDGRKLWSYDEHLVNIARNRLFARMEECFAQELAERYFELRQDILTREHILAEFEAFRAEIPTFTFLKETIRWGNGVFRERSDLPGFDYDQIEDYLDTVISNLDAKYNAMAKQ